MPRIKPQPKNISRSNAARAMTRIEKELRTIIERAPHAATDITNRDKSYSSVNFTMMLIQRLYRPK